MRAQASEKRKQIRMRDLDSYTSSTTTPLPSSATIAQAKSVIARPPINMLYVNNIVIDRSALQQKLNDHIGKAVTIKLH